MSEAEFIKVLEKISDYEGQIDTLSIKPDATPQEIAYLNHISSKLPELKDRFSILMTNPDVIRSSSDIIKLLKQIPIQEDKKRQAGEKLNSSGDQNDAIQYGREGDTLDQLKYDLLQLITAKKAMARGGETAKALRDLYVKQVEVNCAACEKARERLASLDAGSGSAIAAAPVPAPVPAPAKKGWFGRGGRKTRRHKKRRNRQTRSRR
jgi:hypothetical protein